MEVAGYIRVSTEQQKEEGRHETQEERITEWAERNDAEIELFRDIAISGQSNDRPAYEEMMNHYEDYDAIVVRELSRFGRSTKQILQDIERLQDAGTEFVSLKDNFDTSSAQGTLLMQIIAAFNEFWANLARERAMEMVERRRENDEPIGRPRKLDEDQIEQVFEWRRKGISYQAISILAGDKFDTELDRSTVYRYCDAAGVEPPEE